MFSSVFLGKVATIAPIGFKKMKCSLDIAFCTIHFVKSFRDFFGVEKLAAVIFYILQCHLSRKDKQSKLKSELITFELGSYSLIPYGTV